MSEGLLWQFSLAKEKTDRAESRGRDGRDGNDGNDGYDGYDG